MPFGVYCMSCLLTFPLRRLAVVEVEMSLLLGVVILFECSEHAVMVTTDPSDCKRESSGWGSAMCQLPNTWR